MNVLTYEKQPTPDLQKTPVFKWAKIKQEKAVVSVRRQNRLKPRPAVPSEPGAVRGLLVLQVCKRILLLYPTLCRLLFYLVCRIC